MAEREETFSRKDGRGPGGPFLNALNATTSGLDWSGRIIGVACLGFMFFALLANVALRYTMGSGIPWASEIHNLLLPWLVAGGLVIAAARGQNIAVTLLPTLIPDSALRGLTLVIHAVILVICVSVLWSSQPVLKASQFQSLSTLGVKQVWGYSSLIYAFGAMAVIAALNIMRTLGGAELRGTDRDSGSFS